VEVDRGGQGGNLCQWKRVDEAVDHTQPGAHVGNNANLVRHDLCLARLGKWRADSPAEATGGKAFTKVCGLGGWMETEGKGGGGAGKAYDGVVGRSAMASYARREEISVESSRNSFGCVDLRGAVSEAGGNRVSVFCVCVCV
jgi:hypothetical protein